jgi:hypothetical protein
MPTAEPTLTPMFSPSAIPSLIPIFLPSQLNGNTLFKTIGKNQIKINVNPEHILENAINEEQSIKSALSINLSKFGSLTPSVFGRNFKIRVTSKRSKKKMDINLSFIKSVDISIVKDQLDELKKQVEQKTKKTKT